MSGVKAMYNVYVIELVRSTDPFCAKNKVNTMHNECMIELICSFMQESPKNMVKAMYHLYIAEVSGSPDSFYTKIQGQ